jgi:hypothetical protein
MELSSVLRAIEVAVALGAPLGMMVALGSLRTSGIMTSFLPAGKRALASIRMGLLLSAALTTVVALLCLELTAAANRRVEDNRAVKHGAIWRVQDGFRWFPFSSFAPGRGTEFIEFSNTDLSLRVGSADSAPQPAAERIGSTADFPPPPSHWLGGRGGISGVMAGIAWSLPGPTLLLVCGYLVLLLPASMRRWAYLIFLAMLPALGVLMLSSVVSLWTESAWGLVVPAAWMGVLVALVVTLDRLLSCYGLRLE